MARRIPEEALTAIEKAVQLQPEGADLPQIAGALNPPVPKRTLQYRVKYLVDVGSAAAEGRKVAAG